jgi:hypothetical protein
MMPRSEPGINLPYVTIATERFIHGVQRSTQQFKLSLPSLKVAWPIAKIGI